MHNTVNRWERTTGSKRQDPTANKLPTIITTNHNGTALGARFVEPETGAAFVARLREFFDAVSANTQS